MHLHTEIYPNLKSISELFKMYMKSLDSFILASRICFRLYGDSRVSRAQSRINAYEILMQHDWLLFFSRHNRFAETHCHLQLSYHITDRLLAAVMSIKMNSSSIQIIWFRCNMLLIVLIHSSPILYRYASLVKTNEDLTI